MSSSAIAAAQSLGPAGKLSEAVLFFPVCQNLAGGLAAVLSAQPAASGPSIPAAA